MIIKRWIPENDQDVLFQHTRDLREKKRALLFEAIKDGDLRAVGRLVGEGADPLMRDEDGMTAKEAATHAGRENIARYLGRVPAQKLPHERGRLVPRGLRSSRSTAQLPVSSLSPTAKQEPFARVAPPISHNPDSVIAHAYEPVSGQAYASPDAPELEPGVADPLRTGGKDSQASAFQEQLLPAGSSVLAASTSSTADADAKSSNTQSTRSDYRIEQRYAKEQDKDTLDWVRSSSIS